MATGTFKLITVCTEPMPESGGTVFSVNDIQEWRNAIQTAHDEDRILVADFYATWCPP